MNMWWESEAGINNRLYGNIPGMYSAGMMSGPNGTRPVATTMYRNGSQPYDPSTYIYRPLAQTPFMVASNPNQPQTASQATAPNTNPSDYPSELQRSVEAMHRRVAELRSSNPPMGVGAAGQRTSTPPVNYSKQGTVTGYSAAASPGGSIPFTPTRSSFTGTTSRVNARLGGKIGVPGSGDARDSSKSMYQRSLDRMNKMAKGGGTALYYRQDAKKAQAQNQAPWGNNKVMRENMIVNKAKEIARMKGIDFDVAYKIATNIANSMYGE